MSVQNVKNSQNVVNTNSVQTVDTGKTEKAASKYTSTPYNSASNPPSVKDAANVQISSRAKEMSLAKKIAEETPDVREDKVAHYKELINKGEYSPDAEKIANSMVREAMKDELAKDPSVILR